MLFPTESKENNSRWVEPYKETPEEKAERIEEQLASVPPHPPVKELKYRDDIEEVHELDISDKGRAIVDSALAKSNTAYKVFNAQNSTVRTAQQVLRQHHSLHGENNEEYVRLANELNTATQKMLGDKQDYEIAKAEWDNSKRRFGVNITF